VEAVATCLTALRATLGRSQVTLEIRTRTARPAGQALSAELDIVLCTSGADHLLGELGGLGAGCRHVATRADPAMLGYECHAALRDGLGRYDWYGFLEDDLVLRDPLFLAKCAWFGAEAGADAVLQPNRFELAPGRTPGKAYVDGEIRPGATAEFQDVADRPELRLAALGREWVFRRALNPHAGCFFLSAAQMQHFASRPFFLDRSARFIGPLESAATLGLMRSFRVYKPAVENVGFLEIQHFGRGFMELIGTEIALAETPAETER
jgi:hypothetical protein